MPKPVDSSLLFMFLRSIERGSITARMDHVDGREVPGYDYDVLQAMRGAAEKILSGADPDAALHIDRTRGPAENPHNFALALFIHYCKQDKKNTWDAIEVLVADWLDERELPKLSQYRMKKIYRKNIDKINSFWLFAETWRSSELEQFVNEYPYQ